MPKDSTSGKARLHNNHNTVRRSARLARPLPQAYFDAVDADREASGSHTYTDKEVRAIVQYVSHRPVPDPRNPLNVDLRLEERLTAARAFGERIREERAEAAEEKRQQKERRTADRRALVDRIERPSLLSRLDVPAAASSSSATPIALRSALPDFKTISTPDLCGIYLPRISAVRTRLLSLVELWNVTAEDSPENHKFRADFFSAYSRVCAVESRLQDRHNCRYQQAEFLKIDYFCKNVGLISFKQLRPNFWKINKTFLELVKDGYLTGL